MRPTPSCGRPTLWPCIKQWQWERQELNPFFDFIYAASCSGQTIEDAFGKEDLSPKDNGWLEESVDSLQRFPLDRLDWRLINSHRQDIIRLADYIDLGAIGRRRRLPGEWQGPAH